MDKPDAIRRKLERDLGDIGPQYVILGMNERIKAEYEVDAAISDRIE
jgi:hypothetical protein